MKYFDESNRVAWVIMYGILVLLGLVSAYFLAKGLPIVPGIIAGALFLVVFVLVSLRHPDWGLAAFLFSLPFERIPSVVVGGATLRISQVMLAALLVAYVGSKLASRQFKLKLSPYFYPYALFIVALLASFTNMISLSRGILVFAFILFTSLTIWVVPAYLTSVKTLIVGLKSLFVSTLLISVFGVYQFLGDIVGIPYQVTGLRELYTKRVFGFPRVHATALEPLYLANFLIIPLSLTFALFIRRIKLFTTKYYLLLILLPGLIFILTLSRGGYLGLAASLLVVMLGSLFWMLRPHVVLAGLSVVFILTIAVAGLANFSSIGQRAWEEVTRHFVDVQQDASALHRLESYVVAEQAYQTFPITGVGLGNFGPYAANYPGALPIHGWAIVNNEPLELLAETGWFGLLSFVLLLVVLLVRSVTAFFAAKDQMLRAVMLGLIAAIVGVLVQYQFFSTLYIMHIWTLFGLAIAVQNLIYQERRS